MKVVGVNGQISLGKALAGKIVSIEQIDKSTWVIKSGEFIPDSQKQPHAHENKSAKKTPTPHIDNSHET